MLRSFRPTWALFLSISIAPLATAQEPAELGLAQEPVLNGADASIYNQKIADTIAHHLRQSAQLHAYNVNVRFESGIAELSGHVSNQPQRDEVLRIVQGVPGVDRVRDKLVIRAPIVLRQTQGQLPPVPRTFQPPAEAPAPPTPGPGADTQGKQYNMPEPQPVFQAPVPSSSLLPPPKMPPYAWPTYAPYNNFSRVAYPQAYPYKAWPFIGPFYPFPKVPLGWRSVKLEWDDGYWWFSRTATKKDWWRLRFW